MMTDETVWVPNEAVVPYFKVLIRHSLGGTEKNYGVRMSVSRLRFERGILQILRDVAV
jgi:hypothetical protein